MAEGSISIVGAKRDEEKYSIPLNTEVSTTKYVSKGMTDSSETSKQYTISTTVAAGGGSNTTARAFSRLSLDSSSSLTTSMSKDGNNNGNALLVDSALLAAMRDSRERVALLRLEQVMIEFMNASDGYVEVGGPYNAVVMSPNKRYTATQDVNFSTGRQTSFHRCLLHRLADRFGILREAGTLMEGSIRLVKQKDSKIPKKLLLDHIDEDGVLVGVENGGSQEDRSQLSGSHKPNPKRKMKIMKRHSSADSGRNSGSMNSSTPKSRKSKNFSDKEKAYAEARARIFSNEGGSQTGSSSGGSEAAPQANPLQSGAATMFSSSSSLPGPSPSSNETTEFMTKRLSSSSLLAEERQVEDSGRLPVAATATSISKATWRNRRQEENDPDFQRGGGLQMMGPATGGAQPYGVMPGGAGTQYFYPPQQQQYSQQGFYGAVGTSAPAAYGASGAGHDDGYYGGHQQQGQCFPPAVGGRGGGRHNSTGRGYAAGPRNYYGSNSYGANNNKETDLNCMKEFPALGR